MGNLKGIFAAAALLGMSGVVAAGPMTWEDSHSPEKNIYMSGTLGTKYDDTYSWTFDITNDGFNVGSDLVTSYGITLSLSDDSRFDLWEYAFFDQAGLAGDRAFEVDSGDEEIGFSLAGLISMNLDGMLNVALTATSGDFYFKGATLVANGNGQSQDVPEPATLALLGLGLAGLGAARRRQKA